MSRSLPDSLDPGPIARARGGAVSAYLWIAVGSALGGAGRFGVSELFLAWLGPAFPWGTLTVNVVGSWLIGFLNTLSEPDGRLFLPVRVRQFLMIGLCGGYTTFSAFSLETVNLMRHGAALWAGGYVLASVVLCLLFVWLGHILAATLNRLRI
jgi:CrcB protein